MTSPDAAPAPPGSAHLDLRRRTVVMAAGTVLSRLTGFGRVFALAYAFGFSRLTDTYMLANTTPNIVYELVLGGILSATLVPVIVDRLATRDREEAWRAVSALVTVATVAVAVATVLFALASPLVIRLYTLGRQSPDLADQHVVGTTLLVLFAPQVFLYGVIAVATALANARRRFAAPMFAPVANNLVVIGVLLAVPHVVRPLTLAAVRGDAAALALLGLGTTAGVLVQAAVQVWALRRADVHVRPLWAPGHEAVRQVLRLSGWTFGFVAANQIALYVVLVLANQGAGGDVTAYQAALVFFVLPHGVFSVSIMTALQPELAERWSLGDVAAYRRQVALGVRTIVLFALPAAVGYVLLARPIVEVALDHGAFGAASAATTAGVLALLAAGLPGFSTYLMLTRALQAMKDTRTVFLLYLLENGVNIVLALALYPSMGVRGLAVAYAAAYTVAALVAFVHLARRTGGLDGALVWRSLVRTAVASAAMGVAVAGGAALLRSAPARVAVGVVLGGAVYVAVARALRLHELTALLGAGRRTG